MLVFPIMFLPVIKIGKKMRKVVSQIQNELALFSVRLDETFKNYQFILIPTTPNSSFKIGQKNSDPIEMYLEDIFTVLANLAGNPAISVPLGKNGDLPFGIQLMAKNFDEQNLLSFSNTLF
jgi:aspartyl-tRNA(Asn)/glutamyl-tRNA(Gln) amidotransferase subunit A